MTSISSLSESELLQLLDDLESDRVERKESFSGEVRKKAREVICAFSNDLPDYKQAGVLFIGVTDNGEPSDMEVTDELLRALADMKTDGKILPLPVFFIKELPLNNKSIVAITVIPSDMPPVKYDGRIWIRNGPRRAIANEQEERILNEKRRFKNLPYDLYPIPTAKITDLSKIIFENEYLPRAFATDILQTNHRTYEERLATCKMIVSPTETTPTLLGLLTIGQSTQDFIPGACIQFLRIDGEELSDPVIDEAMIGGTLLEQLRRTNEKLNSHNRTSVDVTTSSQHTSHQTYPISAIQQLVYNAVLHRTYEGTHTPIRLYWFNDRIEITSPGGPYGNVTIDNFGVPGITDYRNPNIASVLKQFGFIQAFGRGIAIARHELQANGNPDPEFIVNQSIVQSVVRKSK